MKRCQSKASYDENVWGISQCRSCTFKGNKKIKNQKWGMKWLDHMTKCDVKPIIWPAVLFEKLWTAFIPDIKWLMCAFTLNNYSSEIS